MVDKFLSPTLISPFKKSSQPEIPNYRTYINFCSFDDKPPSG